MKRIIITHSPNVASRLLYFASLKSLLPSLWEFQDKMILLSSCHITNLCTWIATGDFQISGTKCFTTRGKRNSLMESWIFKKLKEKYNRVKLERSFMVYSYINLYNCKVKILQKQTIVYSFTNFTLKSKLEKHHSLWSVGN